MRRFSCLVLIPLALLIASCGGGDDAASDSAPDTTSASTYELVPEAEVNAGFDEVKQLVVQITNEVQSDNNDVAAKTVETMYDRWFTFEGTVRARDQSKYLDLEDALSALKSAQGTGDATKTADAATAVVTQIDAYLAAHPGDGSEAPLAAPATGEPDHRIAVRLTDYEFTVPSAIKGGDVELDLENQSAAKTHELVVFKTDLAADALPVDSAGKIDEKGPGITLIDEKEDVQPGTEARLRIRLEPGRYVFACNVDDHYKRHMAIAVTVS